jgi:hypothetical protein
LRSAHALWGLAAVPSFILSSSFPQVQVVAKQKPIILKHLDGAFFSPLVFTLSQFIVALPFILFDILAFGNVVYWMCGLGALGLGPRGADAPGGGQPTTRARFCCSWAWHSRTARL